MFVACGGSKTCPVAHCLPNKKGSVGENQAAGRCQRLLCKLETFRLRIWHVAILPLQCASVKGGIPQHCVLRKARGCQLETAGSMRLAKLRKRGARLYELCRSLHMLGQMAIQWLH